MKSNPLNDLDMFHNSEWITNNRAYSIAEVKETLKSNVLIPVFMPWRKSTKSEVDSAAGKVRNKKGKVPHDPFKRVSDGSIGSFESTTTTYSGYQEPDIDSVIAGDHKRYSIFVPPQANPMDQNRNMFVEEEFRASTPKVTRMFSELSSSSRTVTRNYSQNLSKPDDLKESPTKVLDLGIPTVGLAKVATVSVKSSASVREVITKNESSLERIMITESLQQKKLEKV